MILILLLFLTITVILSNIFKNSLVENYLPYGDYRADTPVNKNTHTSVNNIDNVNNMKHYIHQNNINVNSNGVLNGTTVDINKCNMITQKLIARDFVYITTIFNNTTNYLNLDSTSPSTRVYFNQTSPNNLLSSNNELISSVSDSSIGLCDFRALKWRFEPVNLNNNDCQVYIRTTYSKGDKCVNVPYYLLVKNDNSVDVSLYKGLDNSKWVIIYDNNNNFYLKNVSTNLYLSVGGDYTKYNSKYAICTTENKTQFSFE